MEVVNAPIDLFSTGSVLQLLIQRAVNAIEVINLVLGDRQPLFDGWTDVGYKSATRRCSRAFMSVALGLVLDPPP